MPPRASIPLDVLGRLPDSSRVLGVSICKDMDRVERECFVVLWFDHPSQRLRKADFCANTGEYLGDHVVM